MWLIQSSTHQLHDLDSNVQEVAKLNQNVRALPSLPKLGSMQFLIEYWIVISAKSQGMPFPPFSEWPFAFLGREFISISLSPHLSRYSLEQRHSRMPTTFFCKKKSLVFHFPSLFLAFSHNVSSIAHYSTSLKRSTIEQSKILVTLETCDQHPPPPRLPPRFPHQELPPYPFSFDQFWSPFDQQSKV